MPMMSRDTERIREDQAQGRGPGGSGLPGRDREHLVGTPLGIGRLGQGHEPREPRGHHHHPDRLGASAVGHLEGDEREHHEQHAVGDKLDVRSDGEPSYGVKGGAKPKTSPARMTAGYAGDSVGRPFE